MLSADGRCHTFDQKANGFVSGEGIGVVLLKKLKDAQKAGDRIYGVIKGWGVNQDGATNGITAPSDQSQTVLQKGVYDKFKINPGTISYVEAHGTGTKLGDPIEVKALKESFKSYTDKTSYCSLGSAKTNIGHTLAAAGVSGVIKVLLSMKHKQLPPIINYDKLNEHIDLKNSPFYINTKLKDWETEDNQPRQAGISSFGFSGTNAHIVIEEYKQQDHHIYQSPSPTVILLSAMNEERLKEQVENLKTYLEQNKEINLYDVAYTLQLGREGMEERLAILAKNTYELIELLGAYQEGNRDSLLRGNIKENKSDFILEGEAGRSYIESAIEAKEIKSLAQLWVRGVAIDWNLLYPDTKPQKLSLPTYPFKRERYWYNSYLGDKASQNDFRINKSQDKMESIWKTKQLKESRGHEIGEELKVTLLEGGIALVQMNSKDTKNMFSPQLIKSLQKSFLELRENKDLKVLVLTGYDNIFCMGGSEEALSDIVNQNSRFTDTPFLYRGLLEFDVPVISAIQGHAFGGGLLFGLYGDMVLLSQESTYTANFMKYGFTPGMGATYILGEKLGKPLATEMMYTAKLLSGKELKERGASLIVTKDVVKESLQIAKELSLKPRRALEVLKEKMSKHILSELLVHISEEETMHEKTFHNKEVEASISTHFGKSSLKPSNKEKDRIKGQNEDISKTTQNIKLNLSSPKKISLVKDDNDSSKASSIKLQKSKEPLKPTSQQINNVSESQPTQTKQEHESSAKVDNSGILKELKSIFEKTLHIPVSQLDEEATFTDLGVDSIAGVEIIRKVNETFSLSLEAVMLYDYHTLSKLSGLVAKESNWLEDQLTGTEDTHPTALIKPLVASSSAKNLAFSSPIESILSEFDSKRQIQANILKPLQIDDIAIIGMSGRLPDAKDVNEFWENLKAGKDSVKEVPERKWAISKHYGTDKDSPGKSYGKWMAILDDEDKFDALFFNTSPKEAERMDPQQRLFLEESWKALEDAGYSSTNLSKEKCGVFVGVGQGDYMRHFNNEDIDSHVFTGGATSILASRISYYLNLHGPAVSIDTACSSSLVAIHQACQSIRTGESKVALAGGVCVITSEQMHIMTSKAGMLSEDGKCRAFDQEANGIVPGEAVGVLVLKSLTEAEKDRDRIYGIIKSSGINQDGKTNGITAPSFESQTRLEKEVYERANINPETITYIEAHGTGTKLGDPIEVKALKETFKFYTNKTNYCSLGSVKNNIGHTLTAAGVSGMIKVLLSLKHKQIPPTINYSELNEHIHLTNSAFYVNTKLKNWKTENNQPRRSAISSFGFSGTNAHMVIEEYHQHKKIVYQSDDPAIIVLSARNEERLKEQAQNLRTYLEQNKEINLYDVAYTLQVGREGMEERAGYYS